MKAEAERILQLAIRWFDDGASTSIDARIKPHWYKEAIIILEAHNDKKPIIHYGHRGSLTSCGLRLSDITKLTINSKIVTCKKCGHIVWGT